MLKRFNISHRSSVTVALITLAACSGEAERASSEKSTAAPAGQTAAATSPEKNATTPSELQRIIEEQRKACDGKVGEKFGETVAADFNADGKTDYVLSQENFLCADHPPGQETWGTWGPQYEFLISSTAGYKLDKGFTQRFGIDVVKRPTGDVIQFEREDMSGEGCAGAFTITWSWTGKKMDLTDRRNAKGAKVDERGCPVGGTVSKASGFPPIPEGYYAANSSCSDAARDSSGTSYLFFDRKTWGEWDGSSDIKQISSAGDNAWKIVLDGGDSLTIKVTGPSSFTEYGRTMRHCPTGTVPADIREAQQ